MNNETIIGEHYWATLDDRLLVVLRDKDGYEVCGPWECGLLLDAKRLVILEHIKRPAGHESTVLYYA